MSVVNLENEPAFGPYSAIVGFDSKPDVKNVSGSVRIEPPFILGKALEVYFTENGLEFEHVVTDSNATIIDIWSDTNSGDEGSITQEFTLKVVRELLENLGSVSTKKQFIERWERY